MFNIPSMQQVVAWFGWGDGIGALAGVSAVLTILVIVVPVAVGILLSGLKRLEIIMIAGLNRSLVRFFMHYVTFPGIVIHELSHLIFAVITGAEVRDISFFEDDDGRLGHVTTHSRGPWFIVAVQYTLIAIAPVIVGLTLGFLLLQYIFAEQHSLGMNIGLWYLIICLINHSTMSKSDIEGYFRGVWIFVVPLFTLFWILGLFA